MEDKEIQQHLTRTEQELQLTISAICEKFREETGVSIDGLEVNFHPIETIGEETTHYVLGEITASAHTPGEMTITVFYCSNCCVIFNDMTLEACPECGNDLNDVVWKTS